MNVNTAGGDLRPVLPREAADAVRFGVVVYLIRRGKVPRPTFALARNAGRDDAGGFPEGASSLSSIAAYRC
jgi:hypothetical protein